MAHLIVCEGGVRCTGTPILVPSVQPSLSGNVTTSTVVSVIAKVPSACCSSIAIILTYAYFCY